MFFLKTTEIFNLNSETGFKHLENPRTDSANVSVCVWERQRKRETKREREKVQIKDALMKLRDLISQSFSFIFGIAKLI